MKKKWYEIESPIPITGKAKNCVELTIYDDDGPEGMYQRMRFVRSSEAVTFLFDHFTKEELKEYNFIIENHWRL